MGKAWALVVLVSLASCAARSVYVVDRIEENVAVLVDERGEQVFVPSSALPARAGEGTVLVDGIPDEDERNRLLHEIEVRRAGLLDDDGSDLSLGDEP